jgi:hypothetical protein
MVKSDKSTHFLSKVRTENYDAWLKGFNEHRVARESAQLFERLILKNTHDPQECYVLFETLDAEKTKAFIDSAALRDFKQSIGVVPKPDYTFLVLERDTDPQTLERVQQAFAAVDRLDSNGFAEFFADGGAFKFGNQEKVVGRGEIAKAVAGFFLMLKSLSHELTETSSSTTTAMVRGFVHYTLADGRKITVPFANSFVVDGRGQFTMWQIYADVTPLFGT